MTTTSACGIANIAMMRGDQRRHLPVLIDSGNGIAATERADFNRRYRVIHAGSMDLAREAKDILLCYGWLELVISENLTGTAFGLTLPASDGHPVRVGRVCRESNATTFVTEIGSTESLTTVEPPVAGSNHPSVRQPNRPMMATLQQIRERFRGGVESDPSRSEGYLRDARDGGMYGYGDGDDPSA